jgi:hypothetical protein
MNAVTQPSNFVHGMNRPEQRFRINARAKR